MSSSSDSPNPNPLVRTRRALAVRRAPLIVLAIASLAINQLNRSMRTAQS